MRALWTGVNTPNSTDLATLQSNLVTIGQCSNPIKLQPPQYGSCKPPAGIDPDAWKAVLNEMFIELFDAQQAVGLIDQLNDIRASLFLEQTRVARRRLVR